MDVSLIFVIVIMLYFCIVFPLQLRRYVQIRRMRSRATTSHPIYRRNVTNVTQQNHNVTSEEQSNHNYFFNVSNTQSGTESRRDDEAARYLEAEHRQQIIDIQREIEQQAIRRREVHDTNPSSGVRDPAVDYSQQIIDLQREIEREAIRRQEEQRSDPHTPHMPPRLINSSTIRTSIYTITPGNVIGTTNSSVNYPHAPPLTPDEGDRERHVRFSNRLDPKDDELPSYEQAVSFQSTTKSVTITRY